MKKFATSSRQKKKKLQSERRKLISVKIEIISKLFGE